MRANKKFGALLVSVIMLMGYAVPFAYADDAVSISTVDEFLAFTKKCTFDEYSKNKKFALLNDIDLKGVEVTPAEIFCGEFAGNGHTISNIELTYEGSNRGLFAIATQGSKIRDLTVTGIIKTDGTEDTQNVVRKKAIDILEKADVSTQNIQSEVASGDENFGAVVGYNEGTIVNCAFRGSIRGQKQTGGIAGLNTMVGIIDSCSVNATVNGTSTVGGIVGYNEGRVKLCKNLGKVGADANENTVNVGGIAGNNKGAVVACTNNGTVGGEVFGDNIGGICGLMSGETKECINNAKVQGRRSVGGICGRFEPYTDIELSYASAQAAVKKQANDVKEEIERVKKKVDDYTDDILQTVFGFSGNEVHDELSGLVTDNRNLARAATDTFRSVSDAINGTGNSNVSNFLDDISQSIDDNLSKITDDTDGRISELHSSLDDTLDIVNETATTFNDSAYELTELIDNLNDAIENGDDNINDLIDKIENEIDELNLSETIDNLNDLSDNIETTLGNLDDTMNVTKSLLRSLEDDVDTMTDNFTGLERQTVNLVNSLNRFVNSIPTIPTLRPLPTINPDSPGATVIREIFNKLFGSLHTTAYAKETEISIGSLQSTNIVIPRLIGNENADTALIKHCINYGEIDSTESAGGIVGATGFESIVRNGENIQLPDGTQIDPDTILKAVINSSINMGDVNVKGKYAGGIAGRADMGNIDNCLSTSKVSSEDDGYVGGICGYSLADIKTCIAIDELDGTTRVGGICGEGKNITNCYSMPVIRNKNTDKMGAVAGVVTGQISANYFIDEGLAGVEGTSLEGKAEAIKPDDMVSTDGRMPTKLAKLNADTYYVASGDKYLPQIKALSDNDAKNIGETIKAISDEYARFHFKAVFIDNGTELKTVTKEYGEKLTDKDIPRVDAHGGEIPMWDRDTAEPIIRNVVFKTEYSKATTTISSGEEPAILLVEGVFADGTQVKVNEINGDFEFRGYDVGKVYNYSLSDDSYGDLKIHVRDDAKKRAEIAVKKDGVWQITDSEQDGTYDVFTMKEPGEFMLIYKKPNMIIVISIAIVIILFILIGTLFVKKIYRKVKANNGKKNEETV